MPTTLYVWDVENDSLIEELDGSGNSIVTYTQTPNQFGGTISEDRGGSTSYYHYDGLGSTLALSNQSGVVTDEYSYSAYGEVVASSGSTTNPFKYVGKYGYYTDSETNDIYIRARTYQPTVARWCSRDPVGYRAGEQNLSRYVENRPLDAIDPTGLWWIPPDHMDARKDYISRPFLPPNFNPDPPKSIPIHQKARDSLFSSLVAMCYDCSHCNPNRPRHTSSGCTVSTCQSQAQSISEALYNTLNGNYRWYMDWGQRYRGYFCYEWAQAFDQAIRNVVKSNPCFSVTSYWSQGTWGTRVHAYIGIYSECSNSVVYFDDGFGRPPGFVHNTPPAIYGTRLPVAPDGPNPVIPYGDGGVVWND